MRETMPMPVAIEDELPDKVRAGLRVAELYAACQVETVMLFKLRGGVMVPTGQSMTKFIPRAKAGGGGV